MSGENGRLLPSTKGCPYQKLVGSEILEDFRKAGHARSTMLNILRSLVGAARSFFKTQKSLALENLALRHQVGVLERSVKRPRLTNADRGLWVLLSRRWARWIDALIIAKPATGGEVGSLSCRWLADCITDTPGALRRCRSDQPVPRE